MPGWAGWQRDLLNALNINIDSDALLILAVWTQTVENRGHLNPLGAKHAAPGDSDFNKDGVKNYPSHAAAVHATVAQLHEDKFSGLPYFIANPHQKSPYPGNPNIGQELKEWGVDYPKFVRVLYETAPVAQNPVTTAPGVGPPANLSKAWRNLIRVASVQAPAKQTEAQKIVKSLIAVFK